MNPELVSVVLLSIGTLCTSFVLGANTYEQIVFIPMWPTPEGLETRSASRTAAIFAGSVQDNTRSAWTSNAGGKTMPSAFAAFALIVKKYPDG